MLRYLATASACALFVAAPFSIQISVKTAKPASQRSADRIVPEERSGSARTNATAGEGEAAIRSRNGTRRVVASDPSDFVPHSVPVVASLGERPSAVLGPSPSEGIGDAEDAKLGLDYETIPAPELSREAMCQVLQEVAAENGLPEPLFTRLIWQESRFRSNVVSRVGAQGIAQFMPETAAERGLQDPFDPVQALPASAEFLRDLKTQFGNFGLAAAAYNGGPGRLRRWLDGKGGLPQETRNYVIQITGKTAEYWAREEGAEPHWEANDVRDCNVKPLRVALAAIKEAERAALARAQDNPNPVPSPAAAPKDRPTEVAKAKPEQPLWFAMLTGSWSEKKARSVYADLQKKYPKILGKRTPTVKVTKLAGKKSAPKTHVGVAANTQKEAEELCQRMKEVGGACIVRKETALRSNERAS
jgi:soluble lytic murein transglycosylase-like protein